MVDGFWHFCSHLLSGQLFAKSHEHAIIFHAINWISILANPYFIQLPAAHTDSRPI